MNPPAKEILISLVLPGYVPPSKNALRGSHWKVLYREKRRAATALRSCLESLPSDLVIGTTTGPKQCRTVLSELDSYAATIGGYLKDGSSLKRHTIKRKKGPKS